MSYLHWSPVWYSSSLHSWQLSMLSLTSILVGVNVVLALRLTMTLVLQKWLPLPWRKFPSAQSKALKLLKTNRWPKKPQRIHLSNQNCRLNIEYRLLGRLHHTFSLYRYLDFILLTLHSIYCSFAQTMPPNYNYNHAILCIFLLYFFVDLSLVHSTHWHNLNLISFDYLHSFQLFLSCTY